MKTEEKRFFEAPKAEIITFNFEDIITSSPGGDGGSIIPPGENEGPFVPIEALT